MAGQQQVWPLAVFRLPAAGVGLGERGVGAVGASRAGDSKEIGRDIDPEQPCL